MGKTVGPHRTDYRQVIRASCQVGVEFTDIHTALAILLELEWGAEQGDIRFRVFPNFQFDRLPMFLGQNGLGVKKVDL